MHVETIQECTMYVISKGWSTCMASNSTCTLLYCVTQHIIIHLDVDYYYYSEFILEKSLLAEIGLLARYRKGNNPM